MTATNAVVCMLRPKVLQFLFKSLDLLSKLLQLRLRLRACCCNVVKVKFFHTPST